MMKTVPIHYMEYITAREAAEVVGCQWDEFNFVEGCENETYATLYLADWKVKELEGDIGWYKNKFEEKYLKRCENELKLIKYLRNQGYQNDIQVYVEW